MQLALREQVCAANLTLVDHGLVTLTWGNVSGLSSDGEVFAIKPSGVSYDELTPDKIPLVSVATGEVVFGDMRPSSDTKTHRILYQNFSKIGGITHTHSTKATAWAQARQPIPCFGTTHADHFYGPIPVTRPLTQSEIEEDYEANTGHVIVEHFSGSDPVAMPGVLVANHAPFVWGSSAMKSVENAVAMEATAEMAWLTLAINPAAQPVESYLMDKHYFRKHGANAYYGQKTT